MKYLQNNKAIRISLIIFLLVVIVCCIYLKTTVAFAEVSSVAFDKTDVLDDLRSSTVGDKPFDLRAYPYDESKNISVINFVEYCYAYRANRQGNYGLYIYVHNPKGLNIITNSRSNKIDMAVGYDSEGLPNDYEKFNLQFCSVAKEQNYRNLFYKFKVVDRVIDGKTFAERVNSIERRYDVSGIELHTEGEQNATEYAVGGTYKFSGYVAGYGPDENAESSLVSTVSQLETIQLDVKSTNFRTASSSLGKDHQNQLDSVYFSVDNEILEKYGKLQKIKAEWYEYKTTPIIALSNKEVFDTLYDYLGVDIGEFDDDLRYSLGYDRSVLSTGYTTSINYKWSYNVECYSNIGLSTMIVDSENKCGQLNYLFDSKGVDIKDFVITSEMLKEWIYSYSESSYNDYLPIKDGKISADLFIDEVDSGRTKGYNCVEIDASEKYDLLSYTTNHGFWDKVCDYGFFATLFGKVPTDENVYGIEPIYAVTDADISGNDEAISKRLLISEADVDEFKEYYNQSKKDGKTTFLFRFAVTDYFAGDIDIDDSESENGMLIKDSAYMAQETVFLDFDIIQLTFNKDGVYHVIPVVSSPIDVVGAITPPVEYGEDWWKILVGILMLVLVVILLIKFFPYIVKAVAWVIGLPFKWIKNAKDKYRQDKYYKNIEGKLDKIKSDKSDNMEV